MKSIFIRCSSILAAAFFTVVGINNASAQCAAGETEVSMFMQDSFSDGWDGTTYTIVDDVTAAVVATGTLSAGASQTDLICLVDGCYTISVGGGSFLGEKQWTLSGIDNGPLFFPFGSAAPVTASFSVNTVCPVFGCTDVNAVNFDAAANTDDGSCLVPDCADAPVSFTYCYQNSEAGTSFYFEPTTAGQQVILEFLQGSIESNVFDDITIHDGADATAPVLYANGTGTTNLAGVVVGSTLGNGIFITVSSDTSVSCGSGSFLQWVINVYCGAAVIPGCTDDTAVNFNPNATIDDGSCIFQDACDLATVINCGDVVTGTTVGAQTFTVPTCVTTNGTGGKVFYTLQGTGTEITASLCGSAFDTKIWIFEGDCNNLVCVTGNDDACGLQSEVTWLSDAATTYLVVVGGFGAAQGAYTLGITCAPPCLENEVILNLTDAAGNGWNGATYTVLNLLTSTVVDSGTLSGGSAGAVLLCVPDGCYNLNVTGGVFPAEVGWELVGADGGTITGGALANVDFSINTAGCSAIGCTDPAATNFDPTAVIDNGSCVNCAGDLLLEISMTDAGNGGWTGASYSIVNVNNGTTVATGSLSSTDSGNPLSGGVDFVCVPQGCYVFSVTGGTNPANIGWEINDVLGNFYGSNTGNVTNFPLAIALGNPACSFSGCTNPVALNYVPSATTDDGSCILPPANDQCINAEAVTCGLTVSGSTINATDDSGLIGTTCGEPVTSPGVWYEFNAASDQFVTASTCGTATGGDTKITVYTGDCNNLVCVAGNDDGCGAGFLSSISFNAETGNNYYIYVSEFGVGTGINFDLSITCEDCSAGFPTNDECVDALPLLDGVAITGSTCCNAPSGAPNFVAGFGTAYDQWFVLNSGNFDTFSFLLESLNGEVVGLMVYDGDCANLDDIAGAQALTVGGSVEAFLTLQPNTDYYFAVFTLNPATCGEFSFTTNLITLGCTDPTAINFNSLATQDDGSCDYTGVAPANDECVDAITLTCGTPVTGSTGGASEFAVGCPTAAVPAVCPITPPVGVDTSLQCYSDVVNGDPFCCNTAWDALCQATYDTCTSACAGTAVVWYTIVGTGDIINISSCGSVIAAGLSIGESANGCAGPFTEVTLLDESEPCDFFNADDDNPSFLSVVGVTYYVQVSSQDAGAFGLDVTCTPAVLGCTNPVAYNFDPTANIDDQSCDFFSGTCTAGGTPVLFNMFDSFGDGWEGATYSITDGLGVVVASGSIDDADFFLDENNFIGPESGFDFVCIQDGCYTITVGGGLSDFEITWNIEDENGNILAGGGAGSVDLVLGANTVCGCTNNGACNFDPTATSEDGSCEFDSCSGCTDVTACNFDASALIDDGSCCFENCVTTDLIPVAGSGTFEVYSIDGTLVASVTAASCATCAVVPPAGVDTNTACYQDVVAADPFCCNTAWDAFCQLTYDACAAGSPDVCSAADPVLCLTDGCYYVVASGVSWTLFGVNGGFISGGDAEAEDFVSFSVGAITCQIGCTEPTACNFDPAANVPDCTLCEYNTCLGCTYMEADNYNPAATIDDQSCMFPTGSTCPGDFNEDGVINTTDLSGFLGAFGTICN